MRTSVTLSFTMECSHLLAEVDETHPEAGLHGHSYKITVDLDGSGFTREGWLVDPERVRACLCVRFDGKNLNEQFERLGFGGVQTTPEMLCSVFWDIIEQEVLREANQGADPKDWVRIRAISVQEGCRARATLQPD